MNIPTCDICGDECPYMSTIMLIYATKDVKKVCYTCGADLNSKIEQLKSLTSNMHIHWFKKWMHHLRIKRLPVENSAMEDQT